MGIKRYILLSIVFILVIGLYVYSFNGDLFHLEPFGMYITLPVAMWVVVPLIFLVLASIFHMQFYSIKNYFYQKKLKKDFESLKEITKQSVLGERVDHITFKTEDFRNSFELLRIFRADHSRELTFSDAELSARYNVARRISQGYYEDVRKYKLSKDNPLLIQNKINRLKVEPKYAHEVLKTCEDQTSLLCSKAYDALLEIASFNEVKRYNFVPNKRTFRRMMERYLDPNDTFEMDLKSIEEMLEQINADKADYLELAREIKIKLSPDALIALFEKLYNSKGVVVADAYLYVLYDLQMIDKIREILENADKDEFVKFRTVIFLRDHGKSIDLDKFLQI